MQVGKASFEGYISNVSHPWLMRIEGRKTLGQIGIAVKEVLGVGSVNTAVSFPYQQLIFG